jgi:hypothetical protein
MRYPRSSIAARTTSAVTDRSSSPCERSCAAADDRPTHDPAVPQPESVARRSRVGSLRDAVAAQIGCGLLATSLSVRVHRILYMSHASVESNSAAHWSSFSSLDTVVAVMSNRSRCWEVGMSRDRRRCGDLDATLCQDAQGWPRGHRRCAPCAAPQSRPWSLHRQLDTGSKPHPGALSQARPLALCSSISSDSVLTRIDKSQLELELNLKLVELVDPEPLTSRPNGLEATGSSLESA